MQAHCWEVMKRVSFLSITLISAVLEMNGELCFTTITIERDVNDAKNNSFLYSSNLNK